MINPPFPSIEELLTMIGETGKRLSEIDASEGASGNISLYIGWPIDPGPRFSNQKTVQLPIEVPECAGKTFIVTGSGRRLREINNNPDANLGFLKIDPEGKTGQLHLSDCCQFQNLTSEWNTHLTVHRDQVKNTGTNFHAIVHGQPLHITYLSHIPAYRDEQKINRSLLRWEAEAIVNLPEGIGFVPFQVPGSPKLMEATAKSMLEHRLVIWAKHGVMARSDVSPKHALDLVEYVETAAHYEYLDMVAGHPADGLLDKEILEERNQLSISLELFLVNLVAVGVWVEDSPALDELSGGLSGTGKNSGGNSCQHCRTENASFRDTKPYKGNTENIPHIF